MAWKIKVKKRLGQIGDFDRRKISFSIFKAAQRVGGKDRKLAELLSQKVEDFLKEKFPKRETITTNEIGNAVEKVLIEEGHAKTAKTFILYREGQRRARKKLIKFKDLSKLREFLELTDKKSVFTTGVYDILHIGHARYLKKASLQGDILIVGLNSDESVKKLKGRTRPVLGEEVRAQMLSFLEFVDFIVIFSQTHAADIVAQLKPDIYVCVQGSWKGNFEDKPEVRKARKCGSKVVVFPSQSSELSTTVIVDKIKNEKEEFRNIQLASAAFLVEDGKMLLVKQKNHSFWTPPGGLIDINEDPQKTCIRETKEETGLDINCYGVLPPVILQDQDSGQRVLVLNYLARRDRDQTININTELNRMDKGGIENYQWVELEGLEKLPLAPNVLPVAREFKKSSDFWKKIDLEIKIKISSSKKDWHFMNIALKKAEESTCWFRKVGCVAVKGDEVLLSSYNRIMPDEGFCERRGCIREELRALPESQLELCTALHAEINLIAQAAKKGVSLEGATMYLTTFPCGPCAKSIAVSGIKRLVFGGRDLRRESLVYLKSRRVEIIRLKENEQEI